MSSRIDYDEVAELYDGQPYRQKSPDPILAAFVAERPPIPTAVLDVACGTGNQLVANVTRFPQLEYVGADASQGMLAVARRKSDRITWVHAESHDLPFDDEAFDYLTCQFAYHHFADLPGALHEIRRVTRSMGRFVLTNIVPHEYSDSVFYRAFPEAWALDAAVFHPVDELRELLESAQFEVSRVLRTGAHEGTTWGSFRDYVSVRTNNSHLTALSDTAYEQGLQWIEEQIAVSPDGVHTHIDNSSVIASLVCAPRFDD